MKFYIRLYRLALWFNPYWINECIVFDGFKWPRRMRRVEAQHLTGFKEINF